MPISAESKLTQGERTSARIIDGFAVIVVNDAQRLHTLNAVGTRIWAMADGRSAHAIATALTDEFDVDHDEALASVVAFADELAGVGALEIGEPAA